MMLGILAKERGGEGQSLESSMIASNLYHNYRDAQAHAGVSLRPVVDHFQYGTGATYRLYECAPRGPEQPLPASTSNPDPRWVFLAAVEDDEFARFCELAERGDLAADPKFGTKSARAEHRAELARPRTGSNGASTRASAARWPTARRTSRSSTPTRRPWRSGS
jgi:crotonobetainyl-CoA:carnitine CoA-transferase CaiB-like acyl-CoA transferase